MEQELITVVIPVFDAEKTIRTALQSVKNQNFGNFEIIIVNDGSTDGSLSEIAAFIHENPSMDIRLLQQPNKGVSAARNTGLKLAKGNYIALLDADDEWFPQKTQRQMEVFKNNNTDLLATARNGRKLLWPYNVPTGGIAVVNFRKLLIRNEIASPTIIFKKKILENIGFYDEEMRYAEDVNFLLRVSKNYRISILNESLVITGGGKKSFGVSGLSANLREMHLGFIKNLNEMHQCKRIGGFTLILLKIFYFLKYILLNLRQKLNR